jgi:hypothetical protein
LQFDDTGLVELPLDFDPSQPFTFEGVLSNNGGGWPILSHDRFSLTSSRVAFNLSGNKPGSWNANSLLVGSIPDGISHYACVYDGKLMRAFIDGKLKATKAIDADPPHPGLCKLTLGKSYIGLMRNVRISKVPRYEKDFTPQDRFQPDNDTLALYHFDEGTGDVLRDSSGNKHDGKIIGAKWVRADGSAIVEPNDAADAASAVVAGRTLADPAFQAWLKATQSLPADKQLEAVSTKLMELNPGFDGKLTGSYGEGRPKIENGAVVGVGFLTDFITDIAPVRAFSGLRKLNICGSLKSHQSQGKLTDLSPLVGMQLTSLYVHFNQVKDLSPLRGMPLASLGAASNRVNDLSPLIGMPLAELHCNNSWQLIDLSPLRGMPLQKISMNGNRVADLSPLAGMSLETLQIAATQVADISLLRGMPLTWIDLGNTKVTDLSPLHDCKTLKSMLIKNQKIDPAEIAKLQQALPDCKIEWDDPATTMPVKK